MHHLLSVPPEEPRNLPVSLEWEKHWHDTRAPLGKCSGQHKVDGRLPVLSGACHASCGHCVALLRQCLGET